MKVRVKEARAVRMARLEVYISLLVCEKEVGVIDTHVEEIL